MTPATRIPDSAAARQLPASIDKRPSMSMWAIVLAGGEGVRLRPLVRQALGEERPKQYVPLLGDRTLLRQTLDRVELGIPGERVIVVTMKQHAAYTAAEFAGGPAPHLLAQPSDRGTAAAIVYPACLIATEDPEAIAAVFPSDHFIGSGALFMAYVAEVGTWVAQHPERLVLLGAQATTAEVEYGWIEPGEWLGDLTTGPVRAVRQFWEKPTLVRATRCLHAGHLWNTSIIVGAARTLLQACRRGIPEIADALAGLATRAGTAEEGAAAQAVYERIPKANFSRSVLEACPELLAVARLPRLAWSDLGSPRRVLEVMERLGDRPAWAAALTP